MRITLRVNNTTHDLSADSRLTLLDALRDGLGLTGTKKGCDQGACGACTVVIDGQRVLSCLTLAAACDGQQQPRRCRLSRCVSIRRAPSKRAHDPGSWALITRPA
jgi:succinate dehydrogenase/fumarate reductase-like Fe-S protein